VLQNGAVIWVLQIEIDRMVQLATVQKTSPNSKSSVDSPCRLPCVANAPKRSTAQIRARRMTHAPCFTMNVQEAINFYSRVLGLRMSDKSGDGVCVHLWQWPPPARIYEIKSDGPPSFAAGMSGQSKR
jgi:Glyoxalase/Bleomycin resistance protein/Dioxygenase superfamily